MQKKKHWVKSVQKSPTHWESTTLLKWPHSIKAYNKKLSQYVNAIDALHSEQQEIKDRHEKEKADLLACLQEMQTSHSKMSTTVWENDIREYTTQWEAKGTEGSRYQEFGRGV